VAQVQELNIDMEPGEVVDDILGALSRHKHALCLLHPSPWRAARKYTCMGSKACAMSLQGHQKERTAF
jgi:hypothetical protein